MDPKGFFDGNTLTISWNPEPLGYRYSVVIDRCDEGIDDTCHHIFNTIVGNATKVMETSLKFSECTMYNMKVSVTNVK